MEINNARRIKNILDGKLISGVTVGIGYEPISKLHQEGEIWEEDGKKFIIKNGIRRSYSKLSLIRKQTILPFSCPRCGQTMKDTSQNKKIFEKFGFCFNCLIEEDTKKMISGTFNEKQKNILKGNQISFAVDLKQQLADFIDKIDAKHFVTEFGDVEDWTFGQNKEELKKKLDKGFDEFINVINKK